MKVRSNRSIALAAAGIALALPALAACGGSSDTTASTSSASTPAESTPAASSDAATTGDQPFGPGCASVPTSGSGSFDGMAADPVATAASHNPLLSTLVTAVGEAKLGDTLNSAQDITVFAPTNDAFKAMDQATLKKAMGDPNGLLKTVLTYHVIPGKLTPEQLAGTHKTLQGDSVTVEGSGEDFTVDGSAKVICGNVQTANATVYIIDGVLAPKG
ncbi:MAG: fasciclin domain-containing protein [Sporichthyaceae bacterium]